MPTRGASRASGGRGRCTDEVPKTPGFLRGARCLLLGAALAALSALAPLNALAQLGGTDAATLDTEARLLFEAGSSAFGDGRYETALERFRQAYATSQRPELLYNIGSAADRLRRDEEALEAFSGYLAALPEAANRREVEARIASLREAIARLEAARGAGGAAEAGGAGNSSAESASGAGEARAGGTSGPSDASRASATSEAGEASAGSAGSEDAEPNAAGTDASASAAAVDAGPGTVHPEWAGWTALGGVVVAATGAIPAALAGGTRSELEQRCGPDLRCPAGYEAVRDRGVAEALAADLLFGLGGAMAVGFGLVWLLVEEPAPPVTASAACGADGCSLSVGGRW